MSTSAHLIHVKRRPGPGIVAVYLEAENLEDAAKWCGGAVKGMRLPEHVRVIDVYTRYGELRAEVGDYIVFDGLDYLPMRAPAFTALYERL